MVYLGFVTGLRPSSMRPLRRKGDKPDVLWDKYEILVRRSQTYGDETMRVTKQGTRYKIGVPKELMAVLQWHVDTQLLSRHMKDSDLLFPSLSGSYRARTVLNKPFKKVAAELGLKKNFNAKGMRRTFQDLTRIANVNDLVTRSISGHHTEEMHKLYSTVNHDEQRQAMGKVIQLFGRSESSASSSAKHRAGSARKPSAFLHRRQIESRRLTGRPFGSLCNFRFAIEPAITREE
jgi:hypothetical protein